MVLHSRLGLLLEPGWFMGATGPREATNTLADQLFWAAVAPLCKHLAAIHSVQPPKGGVEKPLHAQRPITLIPVRDHEHLSADSICAERMWPLLVQSIHRLQLSHVVDDGAQLSAMGSIVAAWGCAARYVETQAGMGALEW